MSDQSQGVEGRPLRRYIADILCRVDGKPIDERFYDQTVYLASDVEARIKQDDEDWQRVSDENDRFAAALAAAVVAREALRVERDIALRTITAIQGDRDKAEAEVARLRAQLDQKQKGDEMSIEPTTQIEMPRYKCHKEVWALKIAAVVDPTKDGNESDGSRLLEFEETDYSVIRVPREWVRKHDPKVGGYYVTYADGYASFSPARAFEDGYTRI